MMANSTVTHRQAANIDAPPSKVEDHEIKCPNTKPTFNISINISLSCPLNIPSTPEVAALRVLRNLRTFLPFYTLFIWGVLLITLIPQRKFSLFLLLINTNFTVMYMLILRAFPSSVLLHRWVDKRLIFGAVAIATAVEMIVTKAGLHLLFTLVSTVPVILIHAVLMATEGYSIVEDQVRTDDHVAHADIV